MSHRGAQGGRSRKNKAGLGSTGARPHLRNRSENMKDHHTIVSIGGVNKHLRFRRTGEGRVILSSIRVEELGGFLKPKGEYARLVRKALAKDFVTGGE